jgi:hypothetical protein
MPFQWLIQSPPNKDPGGLRAALIPVFQETSQEFISDLVRQNLSGRHGDMGLNRRTGNLAGGWQAMSIIKPDGISMTIWISGPGAAYAKIHEFGGEIKPKTAKFLWLPAKANQTPTGEARITPREAIARGGFINYKAQGSLGAATFYATPLRKPRGKKAGPHLEALFHLRKSVRIPARMGATTMFARKMEQLGAKIAFVAGEFL